MAAEDTDLELSRGENRGEELTQPTRAGSRAVRSSRGTGLSYSAARARSTASRPGPSGDLIRGSHRDRCRAPARTAVVLEVCRTHRLGCRRFLTSSARMVYDRDVLCRGHAGKGRGRRSGQDRRLRTRAPHVRFEPPRHHGVGTPRQVAPRERRRRARRPQPRERCSLLGANPHRVHAPLRPPLLPA